MSGKNLALELNARILSASQNAGFLKFNISKTFGFSYKGDFLHAFTYLLKQQIDDIILHTWVQACPKRLLKLYYLNN